MPPHLSWHGSPFNQFVDCVHFGPLVELYNATRAARSAGETSARTRSTAGVRKHAKLRATVTNRFVPTIILLFCFVRAVWLQKAMPTYKKLYGVLPHGAPVGNVTLLVKKGKPLTDSSDLRISIVLILATRYFP